MDHVVAVRVVQRSSDLRCKAHGVAERQLLLACQPLTQRFASNIRHHIEQHAVHLAGIVQGENVRMLEPGGRPDLAQETLRAE